MNGSLFLAELAAIGLQIHMCPALFIVHCSMQMHRHREQAGAAKGPHRKKAWKNPLREVAPRASSR